MAPRFPRRGAPAKSDMLRVQRGLSPRLRDQGGIGMGFDFSRIEGVPAVDTALQPRDIYAALPQAPWPYLREPQGVVLDQWFKRRTESDLVIKMNTGAGKTVVGLLALKSSLNEAAGPAAYFSSDRYLAQQVIAEAEALGLRTTAEPRDPGFLAGEAILVTNIWTLFNGRSKFGVGEKKIDVGTLLIDDAHACLQTAEDAFSLRVPRNEEAYSSLLALFSDSLSQQSPVAVLDLKAETQGAIYEVPFWSWTDLIPQVTALLHPLGTGESDLAWSWPLVAQHLSICTCIFTPEAVEISPPCLPVEIIPSFTSAARRIYLTATLSDDSILVSDFAAEPDSVRRPVTPGSADDIGDRLILVPQEIVPTLTDDALRALLIELGRDYSVVVLVPSFARAQYWSDVAEEVLSSRYGNIEAGVSRLKTGSPKGITVMVSKYDGIDLPDSACRVLVLDGVPEVRTGRERVEASAMADTDQGLPAQMQRIEQGMGRAVRSKQDYCVVLLLGAKLAHRIASPGGRELVSPATRAQLDLSREVARGLGDSNIESLQTVIEQCLGEDPDWKRLSRGSLAGTRYPDEVYIDEISIRKRAAFDAASVGQYETAAEHMQVAVNQADGKLKRSWLKRELAIYTQFTDPLTAQEVLRSALTENRRIRPLPLAGIQYSRLKVGPESQGARLSQVLGEKYQSGNSLLLGYAAVLEDLGMATATSESFESAIQALGVLLGIPSQRPEREWGEGPDNLWALDSASYWVIECKNQAQSAFVAKKDLNQLAGSVNWFRRRYPLSACQPVLIHPNANHLRDVFPPEGTRVITADMIGKIAASVRQLARALASLAPDWSPDAVEARLRVHQLLASDLSAAYTVAPTAGQ